MLAALSELEVLERGDDLGSLERAEAAAFDVGEAEVVVRVGAAARRRGAELFERGVRLWQSNRSAAISDFAAAAQAGNSEANYYLGLNLVEGREARSLRRGQLVAALNYFQRARRGRHSTEARRREEELGREYDRRRGVNVNR